MHKTTRRVDLQRTKKWPGSKESLKWPTNKVFRSSETVYICRTHLHPGEVRWWRFEAERGVESEVHIAVCRHWVIFVLSVLFWRCQIWLLRCCCSWMKLDWNWTLLGSRVCISCRAARVGYRPHFVHLSMLRYMARYSHLQDTSTVLISCLIPRPYRNLDGWAACY